MQISGLYGSLLSRNQQSTQIRNVATAQNKSSKRSHVITESVLRGKTRNVQQMKPQSFNTTTTAASDLKSRIITH